MTFGSLFTGIGGFDLGLERAGMRCAWQVEIDDKCQSVLSRHWPNVPKFKDVRHVGCDNLAAVDLICGGFPCQDLSVAGRRAGLAGERSGLFYEFMRVVAELAPRWVLIENVPGLLSSNRGRDMGAVVGTLGQLGYGWAYRVLDAQYFGVAQRRRRVFIVGCLGDGAAAAQVLFEPESLPGHTPPRRETGQDVTGALTPGAHPSGCNGRDIESGLLVASTLGAGPHGARQDLDSAGAYIPEIAGTLLGGTPGTAAHNKPNGSDRATLVAHPDPAYAVSGQGTKFGSGRHNQDTFVVANAVTASAGHHGHSKGNGGVTGGVPFVFEPRYTRNGRGAPDTIVPPLKAQSGQSGKGDAAPLIAFTCKDHGQDAGEVAPNLRAMPHDKSHENGGGQVAVAFNWQSGGDQRLGYGETATALQANQITGAQVGMAVRRLTPTECERLQGFPDGWTEGQADSARYRQLGNAVCVPCAEWIANKLMEANNQ